MLRPVVACHDQLEHTLEHATEMSRSSSPWEAAMRATNKAANGKNWTIRQLKGRTQITMKLEDGSKPSVLTEIPWQPDKATEILNAIVEVRSFVKAGESLQEANQKGFKALGKESGKAPSPKSSTGRLRLTVSSNQWKADEEEPSLTSRSECSI